MHRSKRNLILFLLLPQLSSIWRYRRKLREQKSCPNVTARQATGMAVVKLRLLCHLLSGIFNIVIKPAVCSFISSAASLYEGITKFYGKCYLFINRITKKKNFKRYANNCISMN